LISPRMRPDVDSPYVSEDLSAPRPPSLPRFRFCWTLSCTCTCTYTREAFTHTHIHTSDLPVYIYIRTRSRYIDIRLPFIFVFIVFSTQPPPRLHTAHPTCFFFFFPTFFFLTQLYHIISYHIIAHTHRHTRLPYPDPVPTYVDLECIYVHCTVLTRRGSLAIYLEISN
ncbi:hypothetical protein C8F04DRAFT_1156268, partial [Mycena alexandri]